MKVKMKKKGEKMKKGKVLHEPTNCAMKIGYFHSTHLFSILLHHFGDAFLHGWKIKGFREMLGKCDTCEVDLLMIKVLKTDKGIKGAKM